jgi:zinc ribbon protein
MQDFVEAAKRAAATAAERAAWEANRLRRINDRQHDLQLAQRERMTLLEQLAGVVLDLDRRGQLTQEPLQALARRLRVLDQEISTGSADVQTIRSESYKPGGAPNQPAAPARRPLPAGGERPCPTCGQPVRDTAAYCSACGTRLR